MIKHTGKYRWALLLPLLVASAGPLLATPATAAVAMDDAASARQALTLINEQRAQAGCARLRVVPPLQAPAEQLESGPGRSRQVRSRGG